MPETPGDFDAMVEEGFKNLSEAPVEAATAEPEAGSTPEAAPAEVVPQETKSPEPAPESPSAAAQPSPAVVDADVIAESLIETDEARNLVAKYKAAGKSTVEAVREALKHSAPAYWTQSKAEAERARAAKEQPAESTSAPVATPAPTTAELPAPAELQAIDARMRALETEWNTLAASETKFSTQLQAIKAEIAERQDVLLTQDLDFEQEKALKDRLRYLRSVEKQSEAYLSSVDKEKRQLDLLYRQEQTHRWSTQRVLELSQAREAEARERQRATEELTKTAEANRRRGIYEAWEANLSVIAKEGDPVSDDLFESFKDKAMDAVARKDPKSGADVPAILREFKREWDELGDKFHRLKSKTYAERKEQHVNVNAPSGANAVAPVLKSRGPLTEDELDQVIDSRFKESRATA